MILRTPAVVVSSRFSIADSDLIREHVILLKPFADTNS